ncbi:MAG: DNA-processing protein DprA [Firmicutes bacterium]|nr:DNA-processing protein DprA [Bacillota bacterium]
MERHIITLSKEDHRFPEFLKNINNPPESLYCIGDVGLLNKPAVAVVGARKCSEYGRQVALKIGEMLAFNDIVTVSGMADGIDAAAHLGALKNGGETIAVLGQGVDICYPKSNMQLYKRIIKEGLIISEYPPGTGPKPYFFPQRNRIISAISNAVTVVEASSGSGSLITAEIAAEQGKEIIAVPGNINSTYSIGCNKLIADGAEIMTVPEDILRIIGIEPRMRSEELDNMGEDEIAIFNLLKKEGELSLEYLCKILKKEPSKVSGIITVMELKGLVSYQLGKIFIAKF